MKPCIEKIDVVRNYGILCSSSSDWVSNQQKNKQMNEQTKNMKQKRWMNWQTEQLIKQHTHRIQQSICCIPAEWDREREKKWSCEWIKWDVHDITTREERLQSHIHRVWLNEWLDFTTIVGHEHSMTDQKCMHIHYLKRAQSSRTHSILTSTNSIRRFSLCLGFVFNFSFFWYFALSRCLFYSFIHSFVRYTENNIV